MQQARVWHQELASPLVVRAHVRADHFYSLIANKRNPNGWLCIVLSVSVHTRRQGVPPSILNSPGLQGHQAPGQGTEGSVLIQAPPRDLLLGLISRQSRSVPLEEMAAAWHYAPLLLMSELWVRVRMNCTQC